LSLGASPIAALKVGSAENLSNSSYLWLDPNGDPVPFKTNEEMEDFLRTANVLKKKELSSGITKPWKVLLEKDGVQLNAVFR
jgi:hypothetical protein